MRRCSLPFAPLTSYFLAFGEARMRHRRELLRDEIANSLLAMSNTATNPYGILPAETRPNPNTQLYLFDTSSPPKLWQEGD